MVLKPSVMKCMFVHVARRVRVVDRPTSSSAGCSKGRVAGRGRAPSRGHGGAPGRCGAAGRRHCAAADSDSGDEASFLSYHNTDNGESPVPPFKLPGNPGFQLPGHYTRGSLSTAYHFF